MLRYSPSQAPASMKNPPVDTCLFSMKTITGDKYLLTFFTVEVLHYPFHLPHLTGMYWFAKNKFLKFESICKQYKPIYQEFTEWHELNFDLFTSKCTISPFQIYFSDEYTLFLSNNKFILNTFCKIQV